MGKIESLISIDPNQFAKVNFKSEHGLDAAQTKFIESSRNRNT